MTGYKVEKQDLYLVPEGAVIITRKELDALSVYDKKKKAELVGAIFTDIEELLRGSVMIENDHAKAADGFVTKGIHHYDVELCETLLADLKKIERKYKE